MARRFSLYLAAIIVALASGNVAIATTTESGLLNDDDRNLAEIVQLKDELAKRFPDSFGGVWIGDDGRTTHIGMLPSSAQSSSEIANRMLTRAPFVVVESEYSFEELHRVYEELVSQAGEGLRLNGVAIASVGVDVQANRVAMVVIAEGDGKLAEMASELPPSVSVTTTDGRTVGTCANSNCANPLKAGLKGYRNGSFACMMGYVMRSGSNYYWATAGHCNSGAAGWRTPSETWQHPAGTSRGAVSYHGWFSNSSADISLVSISASQRSNKLCVYATCSLSSITSRQATQSEVAGQAVCAARQDGISCGTLHSWPHTIGICKPGGTDCRTIRDLRRSTIITAPGDSGGPVYRNSGAQAVGSVSAPYPGTSNTVYSHMHVFETQSGAYVKTDSN
jgi:hypothetical protein